MSNESQGVGQNEIEDLLEQAQSGDASNAAKPVAEPKQEDAGQSLDQDEIDALRSEDAQATAEASRQEKPQQFTPPAFAPALPRLSQADESALPQRDLELLLHEAESALASAEEGVHEEFAEGVATFKLNEFRSTPPSNDGATLELVRDVDLNLRIELGRTHMYLEDRLKLLKGSVVPLDQLAGDPVDIYLNGRLIARGEVLVLGDNFCVRVAELIVGDGVKATG